MANGFTSPAGRGPRHARHSLSDRVAAFVAMSAVAFLAAIVILL